VTLSLADIKDLAGDRFGVIDVACPCCGPEKRGSANQRRRVLRIYRTDETFATFHCVRCDLSGYARGRSIILVGNISNRATWPPSQSPTSAPRHGSSPEPFPIKIPRRDLDRPDMQRQRDKAQWLWQRRRPLAGTIAERYLRDARGYGGALPASIGFLPAFNDHRPCMISAFGLPVEIEPGVVGVDHVVAVHLTKLAANGLAKAGTDADKIVIGSPRGMPIAVAAINDGLGLVIAEGIEDALSAAEATGLGGWAAGSAPFMPYLAETVPTYVESVSIIVDDDKAGRRKSTELAEPLEDRGFEVRLIYPARSRFAA
jgi:Toprim domain-containing protein